MALARSGGGAAARERSGRRPNGYGWMAVTGRGALVATTALLAAGLACDGDFVSVPGGGEKSPATVRAERRAYDGAPPVIPHRNFGITCAECHDLEGMAVEGVGFAPPSPHDETMGLSAVSRCRQCHVFRQTEEMWVETEFVGVPQDLEPGGRLHPLAPPTLPHPVFMRENCTACHTGPAAREEIRTDHPERARCLQCHVPVRDAGKFDSSAGPGISDF